MLITYRSQSSRGWAACLSLALTALAGAQAPSVEEIRSAQKRAFEKISSVRAVIERTHKDESASWVQLDEERRREKLQETGAPPRSVILYEGKGLAWRTSEAYLTKVGTQGFTPVLPKDPQKIDEEIAKARPKGEEIWLQVADFDGKDRYYSRYLDADAKDPKSSALFMRRGLMDRGPLAFGYLAAERPLYEQLEDGPVQVVEEEGRKRYRVRMVPPKGAENLSEAFVTFDPGLGMIATKLDLQSDLNGALIVERFEGRGIHDVDGVWIASEGTWEMRAFQDRKIVAGKTERSRFLDLRVNDPTVDLAMRIPKGEWVTNKDTGQIFEVTEDGSLKPRSWTKKRPTWAATASGVTFLGGVGLFGMVTCLGIARFTRRRLS